MTDLRPYLDEVPARARDADTAPVHATRRAAMARFVELGLPTRRQEAWRFTNLRALERTIFPPAHPGARSAVAAVPEAYRLGTPSHRLVLVNGRFAPELSEIGALPSYASLRPVSEQLAQTPFELHGMLDGKAAHVSDPFLAINTALFQDGYDLDTGRVL